MACHEVTWTPRIAFTFPRTRGVPALRRRRPVFRSAIPWFSWTRGKLRRGNAESPTESAASGVWQLAVPSHRGAGVVDRVLPDRVPAALALDPAAVHPQVALQVGALHAIVIWIGLVASVPTGGSASWSV